MANTFRPPTMSELRENSTTTTTAVCNSQNNSSNLPCSEPVSPNKASQSDKFSTIKRTYRYYIWPLVLCKWSFE